MAQGAHGKISAMKRAAPNANDSLAQRSRRAVWHPCTQMQHHESLPPVPIVKGEGAYLIDAAGQRYFDACSSWWTNLFGHANPRINAALKTQLDHIEHVMLAGFTHEPAVALAERLAQLTGLGHAFYASDGASAVEIALKMSFHHWRNRGLCGKTHFVSLEGSYHGETLGALSVTDVASFREAYDALLMPHIKTSNPSSGGHSKAFLPQTPRQSTDFAILSCTAADHALADLATLLASRADQIAALIVEPLVQGAAGMRMYHANFLTGARRLCDRHNVHLIADEIMTGFGRTGTLFASEAAGIRPDLMCLSKGLTGGYLPLSCVLSTDQIYDSFYDPQTARGFLHSHSYTGSALACRAALATLDIFETDRVIEQNRDKAARWSEIARPLASHRAVTAARTQGLIWAFDVATTDHAFSRSVFARALSKGQLIRPIGNTIYFMPPYVTEDAQFAELVDATLAILDSLDA